MDDRWLADPRPDLGDGPLFSRLLALAYRLDGHDPAGLYAVLHYLRCGGVRLTMDFGRARLAPGEFPRDEYADVRSRHLLPRADRLRALLAEIGVPQGAAAVRGVR